MTKHTTEPNPGAKQSAANQAARWNDLPWDEDPAMVHLIDRDYYEPRPLARSSSSTLSGVRYVTVPRKRPMHGAE